MSPRVWSRFQATRSDGTLVKLRIQELPKSRIDDAVELFIKYFIIEETLHKATGVAQNPQAVGESLIKLNESMKDPTFNYMICCEDMDMETDGKIVGVSAMSLVAVGSESIKQAKDSARDGNETEPATKELRTFFELIRELSLYKVMNELRITHFYEDKGLIVHPQFRKLGIATEFVKAKGLWCVEHHIPATGAVMTSTGTQKAAEKENWETIREINLGELGQRHGVALDGVATLAIWINPEFKQYDDK